MSDFMIGKLTSDVDTLSRTQDQHRQSFQAWAGQQRACQQKMKAALEKMDARVAKIEQRYRAAVAVLAALAAWLANVLDTDGLEVVSKILEALKS